MAMSIFLPNFAAMKQKCKDSFPSQGPFSEEEAVARIDEFEEQLRNGLVEWITIDDLHAELKKRHLWL